MFLLVGRFRTSTFTLVLDGTERTQGAEIHAFEPVKCPLWSHEELRSMDLARGWGLGQAGDTVDINFQGFATGSKSTVTGAVHWIHRRGNQEVERGSKFWGCFQALFITAAFGPLVFVGIFLVRNYLRETRESHKCTQQPISTP